MKKEKVLCISPGGGKISKLIQPKIENQRKVEKIKMLFEGASPLRHSQVRKMQIKLNPLHVQAKQNSNAAVMRRRARRIKL